MTQPDVDQLAAIALELIVRVRDEPMEDNRVWLTEKLPDSNDWFRLAFVLAVAVPTDRSWLQLTAWTLVRPVFVGRTFEEVEHEKPEPKPKQRRRTIRPHGTHAAAQRHRYHGEKLCEECRAGERVWERNRKRAAKLAKDLALVPREEA